MPAENTSLCTKIITWLFKPFRLIGQSITNFVKWNYYHLVSPFKRSPIKDVRKADQERLAFIQNNLKDISGATYQQCLDKFLHVSRPFSKLLAFEWIQKSSNVSPQEVKVFFAHLPVDMQNHLKRHIWEENGCQDNGMGICFGDFVIQEQIKSTLVEQAIFKYSLELEQDNQI